MNRQQVFDTLKSFHQMPFQAAVEAAKKLSQIFPVSAKVRLSVAHGAGLIMIRPWEVDAIPFVPGLDTAGLWDRS